MSNQLALVKKGLLIGIGLTIPISFAAFGSLLLADSLNTFASGDSVSSAKINANFTKIVPIGGIVAWHKDLSGVPALPDGWVECDGTAISDSESVLNGQTAPNLNGDAGTGNGGRFLRGNSAVTTGTFTDDAFQTHVHRLHSANTLVLLSNSGGSRDYAGGGSYNDNSHVNTAAPTSGRTASETRPTNMSVIWIMRIK